MKAHVDDAIAIETTKFGHERFSGAGLNVGANKVDEAKQKVAFARDLNQPAVFTIVQAENVTQSATTSKGLNIDWNAGRKFKQIIGRALM